jgi:hypothetical protein
MAAQAMAGCHFNCLTKAQYKYDVSQIKQQIAKHGLNVMSPKIQIIGRNKKDWTTTVGTRDGKLFRKHLFQNLPKPNRKNCWTSLHFPIAQTDDGQSTNGVTDRW